MDPTASVLLKPIFVVSEAVSIQILQLIKKLTLLVKKTNLWYRNRNNSTKFVL